MSLGMLLAAMLRRPVSSENGTLRRSLGLWPRDFSSEGMPWNLPGSTKQTSRQTSRLLSWLLSQPRKDPSQGSRAGASPQSSARFSGLWPSAAGLPGAWLLVAMPEFQAVQCFKCRTFQVQQVSKAARGGNKFGCRMCSEKQSIRKVRAPQPEDDACGAGLP